MILQNMSSRCFSSKYETEPLIYWKLTAWELEVKLLKHISGKSLNSRRVSSSLVCCDAWALLVYLIYSRCFSSKHEPKVNKSQTTQTYKREFQILVDSHLRWVVRELFSYLIYIRSTDSRCMLLIKTSTKSWQELKVQKHAHKHDRV